jgi:hypothetical protein
MDQGMRDAVPLLLTCVCVCVCVCVFGEAELSTKLTDRQWNGRTDRHEGYSREAGKELKLIRWALLARQHETQPIYM